MSKFIQHEPCPACGSKDNLARYEDGSAYCFGCEYYEYGIGESMPTTKATPVQFENGVVTSISDRGISESTCRHFNVTTTPDDTICFNYEVDNEIVAQKLRTKDKRFSWLTDKDRYTKSVNDLPLFGAWKYQPNPKLQVIVTEGEIDAMSIAELQKCKWPVVSIPGGASSAVANIKANSEWLNGFGKVIFCFDNDEPGRKAARSAAEVVDAGKAYIVTLPRKDANEMLKYNEGKKLLEALWSGQPVRPDGVLAAADVPVSKNSDSNADEKIMLWPYDSMNRKLFARRTGELCMLTAGSGSGKSTFVRELIKHDLDEGHKVGVLMLEESCTDTLHDLMSLYINKPIRKIMAMRQINERLKAQGKPLLDFNIPDELSDQEYNEARKQVTEHNRLYLYDHFGSLESDHLINKMRYMVKALGCTSIYLDHISIVISGRETGDDRKDIDVLMTNLRSFVEETNCLLTAVSHLRKTNGKPHEEGGRITSQDVRGSGSIYQISNQLIALERNQQAANDDQRNCIFARCLKDRFTGFTGGLCGFKYDAEKGRINEIEYRELDDGSVQFGDEIGSETGSVMEI